MKDHNWFFSWNQNRILNCFNLLFCEIPFWLFTNHLTFFLLGIQIRYLTVFIYQSIFICELVIYMKLCYSLWKHDQGMKDKISENDFRLRKRKNIITLTGQVISFFTEFLTSLLLILVIHNDLMFNASLVPIVRILSSTVISISQLWTSHELKRYLKNKWTD